MLALRSNVNVSIESDVKVMLDVKHQRHSLMSNVKSDMLRFMSRE